MSLAKNGDSSGSVAESALPVLVVITEALSGCRRKPNEKRNSSLLVSVMLPSPSTEIKVVRGLPVEFPVGTLGAFFAPCLGCSRGFDRRMDFRGGREALTLVEMCLSSSERSGSRSKTTAGAYMRPLGMRIGAGGPRREDLVGVTNELDLSEKLRASLGPIGETLITSVIYELVRDSSDPVYTHEIEGQFSIPHIIKAFRSVEKTRRSVIMTRIRSLHYVGDILWCLEQH